MKKLIFAAFGVIAFNGVSMANSLVEFRGIKTSKQGLVYYEDCNVWAINFCEEMNGWSSTDSVTAYKIYTEVVAFCEYASEIEYITIEDGDGKNVRFEPIQP